MGRCICSFRMRTPLVRFLLILYITIISDYFCFCVRHFLTTFTFLIKWRSGLKVEFNIHGSLGQLKTINGAQNKQQLIYGFISLKMMRIGYPQLQHFIYLYSMKSEQYSLFLIEPQHQQEVTKFTSYHYVANEPLSLRLGNTPSQFAQAYQQLFTKCCSSGLSFGYRSNQRLVSVALALDYRKYLERIESFSFVAPISAAIHKVNEGYFPQQISRTVNIFVGCTDPLYSGKGLYFNLVQEVEKEGIKKGYRQFNAQCTNPFSERAMLKAGYQILNKLDYNQFQFEGALPFKDMKQASHMTLLAKNA